MLIAHTADLHLTSKDSSRIKILEWIINKVNEKNVNLLVIAGDLFESDTDSTILRPEVRKIFETSRAIIFLLPGNHDAQSYGPNYDYGQNVRQLTKKPFEQITLNNLNFVAVPYQKTKFSDCIIDLTTKIDVLIAHGTIYDFSILPILNEEDTEYMPIYPAEIENLSRCILMGHLHSTFIDLSYKKTRVIYTGAPIALSTKCRSPRKVALIDIDQNILNITPLEIEISPYWRDLEYFVFPGNEENIINRIGLEMNDLLRKNIFPNVNIKGYIEGSESEFKEKIEQIKKTYEDRFNNITINYDNIHSWDRLLKNPFVKKFIDRTSQLEDNLRMKIFELIFPHFDELIK